MEEIGQGSFMFISMLYHLRISVFLGVVASDAIGATKTPNHQKSECPVLSSHLYLFDLVSVAEVLVFIFTYCNKLRVICGCGFLMIASLYFEPDFFI